MSQITTCPSCGTRFRVVADQLRISDGWVRCGQCQEVFDARNYLDAIAPVAPQRAEPPSLAAVPAPAATVVEPPVPAPKDVGSAAAGGPATAVTTQTLSSAPAVVATRPPLPMIPVPAPRAPAPQEAAAPGYELPAPTWADDFDFSDYQATLPESERPADAPRTPLAPGEPVADSSVQPLAAPPVPQGPAAAVEWDASAEPGLDTPVPALPTAAEREEPVWMREPDLSEPVRNPSDFPPLDLSALPQPTPASVPGIAAEVWGQNANVSSLHAHDPLLKNEHDGVHAPLADFSVAASRAVPEERAAAPFAPAATELPVAAEGVPTAPLDAIESAAQKLAQAEAPAVASEAAAQAGAAAAPFPLAPQDEAGQDGADAAQEFGFVRDARRKAWWQKPAVRVAMGAGVVVLPVALALQVALHERNALAAWQPSLRPGLEFMCTALQCQLGPRQQTGAMVVSGSSFAKGERERSYLLNLSIQNRASTPVGVPAVELTLTDAQDQAIARKVISAKALGAPAELAAGAEWSGAVPVTTDGLNLQVVGYRVLLFYP